MKVRVKVEGETVHPKYGLIRGGQELEIDPNEFGGEIFEKINEPVPASGNGPQNDVSLKGEEEN